ncbi:MAG TPA: transporter substrate-binding domain-containing protein, partial [Myxococcota bacterium]
MRITIAFAALALVACNAKPTTTSVDAGRAGDGDSDIAQVKATGASARTLTVDIGDLDAVQKRKALRVLVFGGGEVLLPRAGASTVTDRELVAEFAQSLGVALVPIAVPKFADLIPMLKDGKGDVIVARLAQTDERAAQIAFSRPTAVVDEMLVAKKGDAVKSAAGLKQPVTVRKSSSYRETLDALKVAAADAPEDEDTEALVHDVAAGKIPYTVCDSDLFEHIAAYTPDVVAAFPLKQGRQIGFGVRKENAKL